MNRGLIRDMMKDAMHYAGQTSRHLEEMETQYEDKPTPENAQLVEEAKKAYKKARGRLSRAVSQARWKQRF